METLSVRERHALAAATARRPPETAAEAVNRAWFLENYRVCPAGTSEALGRFCLRGLKPPEDVPPHVDFEQLGRMYEDEHPGLFIGSCYVEYPRGPEPPCRREDAPLPEDNDWSVKLKLASSAVPKGVWLRLPDYDGQMPEKSGEGLADFAANHLRDEGVPEGLIRSGVIDLDNYAKDLLETSGYVLAADKSGYIIRNSQEFVREYSTVECPQDGMSMMQQ